MIEKLTEKPFKSIIKIPKGVELPHGDTVTYLDWPEETKINLKIWPPMKKVDNLEKEFTDYLDFLF